MFVYIVSNGVMLSSMAVPSNGISKYHLGESIVNAIERWGDDVTIVVSPKNVTDPMMELIFDKHAETSQ